jgi:hypothetical protein
MSTTPFTRRTLFASLCLATSLFASPLNSAYAGPTNFLYEACSSCAPKDLAYSAGEFDQVHWVAAESGATNRQLVSLSVEAVSKMLQQVQVQEGNKELALLEEDGAQSLAAGIVAAMNKAASQQDAIFLITNRMATGFVSGKQGNSGRAFVTEQGLNIIFGEAHVEFFNAYRAARMMHKFEFGSRKQASKVVLKSNYLVAGRKDWLVFPLQAQPVPSAIAPAVQYVGAAPAAVLAPAPVAPAAPATVEQNFAAQEARLKGLKRLREQNLITEEEYQAKKRDILKDL